MVNGYPYTVIGVLEKKKQNGSYGSGPDNTQLFVPFSAMARDFPPASRTASSPAIVNNIVVEPVSPDLHETGRAPGQAKSSPNATTSTPIDNDALWVWDTLDRRQVHRSHLRTS